MSASKSRLESENAALRAIVERQAEVLIEIDSAMGHRDVIDRVRAALAKLPKPGAPPPPLRRDTPSEAIRSRLAALFALAAIGGGIAADVPSRYQGRGRR